MTVVFDASALVAALSDSGGAGPWANQLRAGQRIAGPHLLPIEVANNLRRQGHAGTIGQDSATLAHAELLRLDLDLHSYEPLAERAWELRHTVTVYDACYVVVAEHLGVPLVTLDRRLSRATGPRCEFLTPP